MLLAAVVKTKIERFRETQRSTRIDGLTGLLNHTAAKSQLKTMASGLTSTASRTNSLTVAMIDIDHFKAINDTYGHAVGDAIIAAFGAHVRAIGPAGMIAGRIGGEEFAIMLVDTPADSAVGVVDRLLDAIRHKPADHPASHQPIAFTASIGCTESQPEDDELTALARADRALYIAKQSGRDRHAWV